MMRNSEFYIAGKKAYSTTDSCEQACKRSRLFYDGFTFQVSDFYCGWRDAEEEYMAHKYKGFIRLLGTLIRAHHLNYSEDLLECIDDGHCNSLGPLKRFLC